MESKETKHASKAHDTKTWRVDAAIPPKGWKPLHILDGPAESEFFDTVWDDVLLVEMAIRMVVHWNKQSKKERRGVWLVLV